MRLITLNNQSFLGLAYYGPAIFLAKNQHF